MTLNTVKPRSSITPVSRSTVCATDSLLSFVMIPVEDCGSSTIKAPTFSRPSFGHMILARPSHLVSESAITLRADGDSDDRTEEAVTTYAAGRPMLDADSHLMELPGFLDAF